jgi:uncharacterized membrane protein YccC
VRRLIALRAGTPSLRLLADQTAEVLGGISHALNGLALLLADPARPVARRGGFRLRVPDWLPSLVNAGRAFVVIGAAELFWIITEWPNGAGAITWAAIGVTLFAPRYQCRECPAQRAGSRQREPDLYLGAPADAASALLDKSRHRRS